MVIKSLRRALLSCAALAALAHSLVHSCLAAARPLNNAPTSATQSGVQGRSSVAGVSDNPQEYVPGLSGFLEGKNPAYQVAALNSRRHLESAVFVGTSEDRVEAYQPQHSSNETKPLPQLQPSGADPAPPSKVKDYNERLAQHKISPGIPPPRRLQLLAGLSQLTQLPQLGTLPNFLGSGLSARDRDQLETFSRRVATSRERVYKDLLFATGGRLHGMDEFAMKQLVTKVGLENLSSGTVPSSHQFSHQELRVLDAARRSHFSVQRIIASYEREVAQHARTLRNTLEASMNNPIIRSKIASIASDNLFKRPREVSVRRLQDSSRNRSLAALLQGPGLLGSASSFIRSMDPSGLSQSLSAGLGGLGLQHLHLPNIGGLGLHQDGTSQGLLPITDISGLQQALQAVFPLSQQVTALSGPLRSFQQGVETATDGAIGAFLSREGLLPFLSVGTAKELLGGLIGGEAVGPQGLRGWDDLGLSPVSVSGLAAVMPFDTFLTKFAALAHEVDSDVGVMKREARKRLGAGGVSMLPEQLSQVDNILDRLVWGTLRAPVRRLQHTEATGEMRHDWQPHLHAPAQHMTHAFPMAQLPNVEGQNLPTPAQHRLQPLVVPNHQPKQITPSNLALKPNLPPPPQQAVPEPEPSTRGHEQSPAEHQVSLPDHGQPSPDPVQYPSELEQPMFEPEQRTAEPEEPTSEPGQTTANPAQTTSEPERTTPNPEQPRFELQQPTADPQRPVLEPEPEKQAPVGQDPQADQQEQNQQKEDNGNAIDTLFGAMLGNDIVGMDPEEAMQAALQRVELLADAVTVLLKEYEKAVEHLQDLLDDQLDAAEEIREELEDQVTEMKDQVKIAQKPKREGAAAAAAAVARVYDEAVEGLKASLEALLEQPEANQPTASGMQEDLAALAARIQAVVEEKLPSIVTAP